MRTAVFYGKDQARQFLQDRPDADRIYPLTPNALAEIGNSISIPLLTPIETFGDYRHRRVLARTRRIERKLEQPVREKLILEAASWEVWKSTLYLFATTISYLQEILRDTGPWLIHNGDEWVNVDNESKALDLLFSHVSTVGAGIFGNGAPTMQSKNSLLEVLNWLILKLCVRKRSLWITGYEYNFKTLVGEIERSNKEISVLVPGSADKRSVFRTMRMLSRRYLPWVQSESVLEIIPVTHSSIDYIPQLHAIFVELNIIESTKIVRACAEYVGAHINYTESLVKGMTNLVKRSNATAVVAHQLRWMSGPVLAQAARNSDIPCRLVSHGSHPLSVDEVSRYALDRLEDGSLVSTLATEYFLQSPQTNRADARLKKNIICQPSKPIMWGHKVGPKTGDREIFTILHAGTYKPLCSRPWIFETSNEFVYGLQKLIEGIEPLEHVRLIIRIREDPTDINLEALQSILPTSDKYKLSFATSFRSDLELSDMLISFSSTTIEEALYANRPVGLFGGSNRYRHLPGNQDSPKTGVRSAVYHLSQENLTEMLRDIVVAHKNAPLTESELKPYVWGADVPGKSDFVGRHAND